VAWSVAASDGLDVIPEGPPNLESQETPARQQDDRSETAAKPIRLRMTPAVACRSIDGYEQ
jgi:hypothetical protein